jgi:hypothetical protein
LASHFKTDLAGLVEDTDKHGAGVEIDPAVELMLLGVESHAKGPPVWKVMIVNLKPTRLGGLRGALMSITRLHPTAAESRAAASEPRTLAVPGIQPRE